jgi:nitrite reductase (NO-forming)
VRTRTARDKVALGWLLVAVVLTLVHRWVPESTWLMVHVVLLGALTHAAMVWSEHFAHTLLRTRVTVTDERSQTVRILILLAGAVVVMVGVPASIWPLTVVGATIVGLAVIWHGWVLWRALRSALPNRFRVVSHYYLAAAFCLPVGAGFGATLARDLGDEWHGRLLVAHTLTNLLGWIGLTVTGTLVTLWPTMLRTRMDDRAERLARQALPILITGIAVLDLGALGGWRFVGLAGLLAYVVGLAWWGRSLVAPLRQAWPREYAPAAVGAALCWGTGVIVAVAALLVTSPTWHGVADRYPFLAGVAVVGFAAQLLLGALSYLVPSLMGGGPAAVRAARSWVDRWGAWRIIVVNGGLALWLVTTASWVRVTLSTLVLAGLVALLPLLWQGVRASRTATADAAPAPRAETKPAFWTGNQIVAAVAAIVLTITAGAAVDPTAAGLTPTHSGHSTTASAPVTPTGTTVRIEVTAKGMSYTPARVQVNRGDRLVVVLTNADPTTSHDLVIGSSRTPRLSPGASAELDAGVIATSLQGWCSVAGHRQMGMVFDVVVAGESAPPQAPMSGTATTYPAPSLDTPLTRTVDATLGPIPTERIQRLTLRVTEVPLEVAPGVWQRRWTYNGSSVGPTLHGRVGDVFEITLVNDGTMGHSIDFHAGALAPDRPMRTIPPGESLTYRFTATRAGIWMYHCSTMPMSAHIAAGMHGAVVIEPENLPAVDRSYVLVQSEVYLASAGETAATATEVDAAKVTAERPDRVVFNGVANQYDQARLTARVGERVRVWVLDAGPNRPSSFHIVGGQFDTVWREGGYLLRQSVDAYGNPGGGSQALALQPAEGGFVELVFPEAGNYPVVSHVMVDAERGAHGFVTVTP